MTGDRNRILVTGATGFIGRHLLRAMLDQGRSVDAMVRPGVSTVLDTQVQLVRGDLDDHQEYVDICRGYETIVHLAAYVPRTWNDASLASSLLTRNALATLHLAKAAANAGVRRFIYATSGNVYREGSTCPREDDPAYPSTYATYYLASKLTGELYVEHLRLREGLNCVTLRFSSVYGPGMQSSSLVSRFMTEAHRGGVLQVQDGGRATYDLVYVEDAVAAIIAAINGSAVGVFNIGSGTASTITEVAHTALTLHPGSGATIVVAPPSTSPLHGFPALCIDRARAHLAYSPRNLLMGLTAMRDRG